jgi:hypothetical protein
MNVFGTKSLSERTYVNKTAKTLLEIGCGLALTGGAGFAWNAWQINGWLACFIALTGLTLITHPFTVD